MGAFGLRFASSMGGGSDTIEFNTDVNQGAVNDDIEAQLRQFLNPALKGPNWDGFIAALAAGDRLNRQNAQKAFDQLSIHAASGNYLIRRAADRGVRKPKGLGMPDALFRQYAINTATNQLTEESLLEVLEVFYGENATRARASSGAQEPYNLVAGDDLTLRLDNRFDVQVVFDNNDWNVNGAATSREVAAAITRVLTLNGSSAYALAVKDRTTGTTGVQIYSQALGLASCVTITGGSAQRVLQFPRLVQGNDGLPSWTITFNAASKTLRYAPDALFDISTVQVGDYVIVGADFNAANRGTYTVTNVYWAYPDGTTLVQWFEVVNATGVAETPTQTAANTLVAFRPVKNTIHNSGKQNAIVAVPGNHVDILLPATSQAVGRGPLSAAYLHAAPTLSIATLTRVNQTVTVETTTAHGLSVGSQVFIDLVTPSYAAPSITAAVDTRANGGTAAHSAKTIWSSLDTPINNGVIRSAVLTLPNGQGLFAGGDDTFEAGGTVKNTAQRFVVNSLTPQTDGSIVVDYDFVTTTNLPAAVSWAAISATADEGAVLTGGTSTTATSVATHYFNASGGTQWSNNANLNHARYAHTQTLLNNGTILVAGGANFTGGVIVPLTSCELGTGLSATTGSWANTGALTQARFDHQAVKLADGRVLAVGGRISSATSPFSDTNSLPLASCEIYSAGTWTTTGSLTYARFGHALVELPDGRVLAIGGVGGDLSNVTTIKALRDVEVYDPATGRWAPAGRMAYSHGKANAFYLASRNQVVVVGGDNPALLNQPGVNTTEIYNVESGKWSIGSQVPGNRAGAQGLVVDGQVVVVGGFGGVTPAATNTAGLLVVNSDQSAASGINDLVRVSAVVDSTHFQYETAQVSAYTAGGGPAVVQPLAAVSGGPPGPYVIDPTGGVAWTSIESTTTQSLTSGHSYNTLQVADASVFPDAPGWLVIDFGYAAQASWVPYLGRLSDTTLAIDFRFKFPTSIPPGAKVNWLFNRGPYVPDTMANIGGFYLTDSPSGRIAASLTIDDIVGVGITVNKTIVYPGDRGLSGEGQPTEGLGRLSDAVVVWGGDDAVAELKAASEE